jgi:hypothetical protein
MRTPFATLFGAFVLLAPCSNVIVVVVARQTPIISAALDLSAIENALVPPFANVLLPVAINQVNDVLTTSLRFETTAGTCCALGDFGVRVRIAINNLQASNITEDKVKVVVEPHPTQPNDRFLLRIYGQDLKIETDFSYFFGVAAVLPVPCNVAANLELTVAQLGVVLDIGVKNKGKTFNVELADVFQSRLDVNVNPIFSFDACSIVSGFILEAFNVLQELILRGVTDLLGNVIVDLLAAQLGSNKTLASFDIPVVPGIEILPRRNLTISPELQRFTAINSDTLETVIGAGFKAELGLPEWRAGSYFEALFPLVSAFPAPTVENPVQAKIRLGAAGLNGVIQSVWYLIWSNFAPAELAITSPECKDLATFEDRCPFPPIVDRTTSAGGRIDFWLLSLISWYRGFFTAFEYRIKVSPPDLVFDSNKIRGKVPFDVTIVGVRWLLGFSQPLLRLLGDASVDASFPNFDPVTGKLSGLRIGALTIRNPNIMNTGLLLWVPDRLIELVSVPIISGITSLFLGTVNDQLKNVLDTLPPILFPTLNDVLQPGLGLQINLTDVSIGGVPGTSDTTSYLSLTGSIHATFVPSTTASKSVSTAQGVGSGTSANIFAQRIDDGISDATSSSMIALNWTSLTDNPGAVFYSVTHSREGNTTTIRTFRVADGRVEEQNGAGFWVPVP